MALHPAYRLALAIHDHLQQRRSYIRTIDLPEAAWFKCQFMQRQIRCALANNWQLAAERLDRDFRVQLKSLLEQIRQLVDESVITSQKAGPTAYDIYEEISSLESEFEEVSWCIRQGTLSVTTSEIVLKNIALGPFQIVLDWRSCTEFPCFRVIALDPNPADCREEVTHPHVENESLCMGDARLPIWYALEQGRFADFFLIVNNILQTYNSGSPYVALEDWHGVRCSDCGDSVNSEDRYTCEKCEDYVCDSCCRRCESCDSNFCSECVTRCEACDEDVCYYCQQSCSSCESTFCPRCLKENVCDNCEQNSNEEDADGRASNDTISCKCSGVIPQHSQPQVHANCLEQAAVLS